MKLLKRLLQARVTLLILLILPALGSGCAALATKDCKISADREARANELLGHDKACPQGGRRDDGECSDIRRVKYSPHWLN